MRTGPAVAVLVYDPLCKNNVLFPRGLLSIKRRVTQLLKHFKASCKFIGKFLLHLGYAHRNRGQSTLTSKSGMRRFIIQIFSGTV